MTWIPCTHSEREERSDRRQGVAILLLLERRFQPRWRRLFGLYLIWYGLGRSLLEAIRIDPTSDGLFGIPANVWASFVAIALGLTLFILQTRRHPEPETSILRVLRPDEDLHRLAGP